MSVLGDIRRRADGKSVSNELLVEENEKLRKKIQNLETDLHNSSIQLKKYIQMYNKMLEDNKMLHDMIDALAKKGVELAMEDNSPVIKVYENDCNFPDTSANWRVDTFSRW